MTAERGSPLSGTGESERRSYVWLFREIARWQAPRHDWCGRSSCPHAGQMADRRPKYGVGPPSKNAGNRSPFAPVSIPVLHQISGAREIAITTGARDLATLLPNMDPGSDRNAGRASTDPRRKTGWDAKIEARNTRSSRHRKSRVGGNRVAHSRPVVAAQDVLRRGLAGTVRNRPRTLRPAAEQRQRTRLVHI